MITLTSAQMQVFENHVRLQGNLRLANYIEERFPGILRELDDVERIALAESYRVKAASHDFVTDEQIGTYMDMVVMYGSDFAATPGFSQVMDDTSLEPFQKIDGLKTLLMQIGVAL